MCCYNNKLLEDYYCSLTKKKKSSNDPSFAYALEN